MKLLVKEYKLLEKIQEKFFDKNALADELKVFLDLIVKSGNELEMLNYMQTIGFNSIESIKLELKKNYINSSINTGLMVTGGAILLAFLLSK